jgi:hypothetical protein
VADGLGWVYAVSGRRADALTILRRFNDLSSHVYVDFYQLATIYAGLGQKKEAFRMLEKGYAPAFGEHALSHGRPILGRDAFRSPLCRPAAPDGISAVSVHSFSRKIPSSGDTH